VLYSAKKYSHTSERFFLFASDIGIKYGTKPSVFTSNTIYGTVTKQK